MESRHPERRREERFPIEAGAIVAVNQNGQTESGTTVDISGCGVLLQFKEPVHLAGGDQVICDFSVPQQTEKPLPYWVVGSVVRVDGCRAAIDFQAGGLSAVDPKSDGPSPSGSEHAGLEA